jgi:hypothetical protein
VQDKERYDHEMATYSGPLRVPKTRKARHPVRHHHIFS